MRARRKRERLALVNCPQCGYSLEGLPASHRCPECGAPYTRELLVFRAGVKRARLAMFLLCLVVQVPWFVIHGLPQSRLLTFSLFALWIGAIAGFWGLFLWRRAEVHVTPFGVEFLNVPDDPTLDGPPFRDVRLLANIVHGLASAGRDQKFG